MSASDAPIAYPGKFAGKGVYKKAFAGTGFGVVFEDDGPIWPVARFYPENQRAASARRAGLEPLIDRTDLSRPLRADGD